MSLIISLKREFVCIFPTFLMKTVAMSLMPLRWLSHYLPDQRFHDRRQAVGFQAGWLPFLWQTHWLLLVENYPVEEKWSGQNLKPSGCGKMTLTMGLNRHEETGGDMPCNCSLAMRGNGFLGRMPNLSNYLNVKLYLMDGARWQVLVDYLAAVSVMPS